MTNNGWNVSILHRCCWAVLCVLALLAGCATRERYDQKHAENLKRTNEAIALLQQSQSKPNFAVEDQRMVMTTRSIPLGRDAALPEKIQNVTFRSAERWSLKDIAERLSRDLQIPVILSSDLRSESASASGLGSRGKAPGSVMSDTPEDKSIVLDYSGSLPGLLDQLSLSAQVQWKYEGGRIVLYRTQTVTYAIKSFSTDFKISTPLGGSSGGGGGGGGGSGGSGGSGSSGGGISGTVDAASDFWPGFEAGLKILLSDKGKYSIDKNAGLLLLTDVFRVHEQVDQYMAQINAQVMRQIALDVEIITVDLNQDGTQGIDWTWINSSLQSAGQIDKLKFTSPSAPSVTVGGHIPFTVSFNPVTGRNAMFQLLQAFGKVSTAYSGILVTTNRTAVPVAVNNSLSYLAQTTPAAAAGAVMGAVISTTPGLTPGQITTGTNLTLLPLILDSNQVLLQSVIRISSLKALSRFDSGQGSSQQSIQLPNVDSFTVVQRVVVPTGQTMVMMGYDRVQTATTTTGLAEGVNTSKSTTGAKQSIVVLVTPRMMDI